MFSKKDIFTIKLAIERDGKLSHGAARLGLRVCSYVYNDDRLKFRPHEPFPLPWTLCNFLCWNKMSERESYRNLRELVDRGHLAYEGVKGCPGKAHFRLVLAVPRSATDGSPRTAENGSPSPVTVGKARAAKCDSPSSAKKDAPLTKLLPTEEMVLTNEDLNARKRGETRGDLTAASPEKLAGVGKAALPKVPITDAQRRQFVQALSRQRRDLERPTKAGKLLRKKHD